MRKAFTLIELAIGLVILGILLGIGINMAKWAIKNYHLNQNRDKLLSDAAALVSYVVSHEGNASGACNSLPYLNDEWGKRIICLSARELENYNICALRKTSLVVKEEGGNETENVAFVLISGGENLNVQTGIDNSTNGTVVKVYPYGESEVDDYPKDFLRKEPYDDMVRFVTLKELQEKVNCPYSEAKLRIITDVLPPAFEDSFYEAKVFATGGIPEGSNYRWCYTADDNFTATSGIEVYCGSSDNTTVSRCPGYAECPFIRFKGNPKEPGTYRVVVRVADREGNSDKKSYVLTVNGIPSVSFGNGTDGTGCIRYTVVVENDSGWVDVFINNRRRGSADWTSEFIAPDIFPNYKIKVTEDWHYNKVIFEGIVKNLDTNGDCVVHITCLRDHSLRKWNCTYE